MIIFWNKTAMTLSDTQVPQYPDQFLGDTGGAIWWSRWQLIAHACLFTSWLRTSFSALRGGTAECSTVEYICIYWMKVLNWKGYIRPVVSWTRYADSWMGSLRIVLFTESNGSDLWWWLQFESWFMSVVSMQRRSTMSCFWVRVSPIRLWSAFIYVD